MSLLSTANEWGEAALGSLPFGSVLVKAKQSGAALLDKAWDKITGTRGLKKDVAAAAAELITAWKENYFEDTGWTVSSSIRIASFAPRLRASMLTLPLPAKRSRTRIAEKSRVRMLNSDSLTLAAV